MFPFVGIKKLVEITIHVIIDSIVKTYLCKLGMENQNLKTQNNKNNL